MSNCICGKTYSNKCTKLKCKNCCDSINCEYHFSMKYNINKSINRKLINYNNKCSCGRMFSNRCVGFMCGNCCISSSCKHHGKTLCSVNIINYDSYTIHIIRRIIYHMVKCLPDVLIDHIIKYIDNRYTQQYQVCCSNKITQLEGDQFKYTGPYGFMQLIGNDSIFSYNFSPSPKLNNLKRKSHRDPIYNNELDRNISCDIENNNYVRKLQNNLKKENRNKNKDTNKIKFRFNVSRKR